MWKQEPNGPFWYNVPSPEYNILEHVPEYDWYHGCGPTAVASILGYWDIEGYSNLFDVSGWETVKLTDNVRDHISSPQHNTKYDDKPDDPNLPDPPDTSIADFFHTSEGTQEFGWSFGSDSDDAFRGYAAYRGYKFDSQTEGFTDFTWADLTWEIDAGRPVMFLVDSDGNGETDHFVPVFGYDDRGRDGLWYAHYTNWQEEEKAEWHEFQQIGDDPWGVASITTVEPTSGNLLLA